MSHLSELDGYIVRLQRRLRLGAWLRGAAVFTGAALGATILLVLVLNHLAFPRQGVLWGRAALFMALLAAAAFGIVIPLRRLTQARAVRQAEASNPDLEQRLTTFYETQAKGPNPFLELLAADTLARAEYSPPNVMVPDTRIFAMSGAALGCLAVLIWLVAARPGYVGYGASLLWTGPKTNAPPLYALTVTPGDATVRRNGDQLITAHITGMQPDRVQIFAHYQSASGWEPALMQSQPDTRGGAAWQFVMAGLPENVEYYVVAGPLISPHYKLRVVDLPSINSLSVTYHYPKWSGMKSVTQASGDLRAIEGTEASIQMQTDRPLKDGLLKLNDGQSIQLSGGEGNRYQATIHMEKDGAYHFAATEGGREVRLSEDYFIATDQAPPPEVSIDRPAGDYRASPIEEITVRVKATDAFGLKDMHLHYSVNGGPDRNVSLLKTPGAKEAGGSSMLPLEDFKVQPGDLVSVYATARDGHAEAKTDISFIQVDPFEREFSQSQQSGGGGGGGGMNSQTDISRREKELIAATWKQQNDTKATAKDAAAAGQFLSGAQQKLRDQVLALSARMQSRDLSEANQEFNDFAKDMQLAAAAMSPSAEKLRGMRWKDALPLEQKALQALLRAEATFRQIQVAFGQQGGGSGGGNTGRDLASLFDLELDTEKNQYETAQTASPADQHQKAVEDALQKLDALARRQQDLANQQHNPQQGFQQRWQEEVLRREAEQLQRQLEQMAANSQQNGGSSSSQSSSGQQSGASRGSSGHQTGGQLSRSQSGGQNSGQSSDQRIEDALNRLRGATSAMRNSGDSQRARDAERQAAEQLRQAANSLAGEQQQLASGKLQSLTREAGRLRDEEHTQAQQLNKLGGQPSYSDLLDENTMMARLRQRDQLSGQRQQLANDLSNLQKKIRDTARELAPNQPTAAGKLRDALNGLDGADLDNRVQRSADWLRRGINPNTNGTESEIAGGLQTLHQQLQAAQSAIGKDSGKDQEALGGQNDQSATLGQIERLRRQLEAMGSGRPGSDRSGRPDLNSPRSDQQPGNGERSAQNDSPGQWQSGSLSRQGGNPAQRQGGNQTGAGNRAAESGQLSGDVRRGGGHAADGTVWGNINTGDNRYGGASQWAAPSTPAGNPADPERAIEQGLRELRQLRQTLENHPETAREVDELARKMRALDPKRFPGNPALADQLHDELLSSVDRLELQLRREAAANQPRAGKADTVPPGYEESVADYYRRLSNSGQASNPR